MFRQVLQEMVEQIPGARGAIFLDHEGEAVERFGDGVSDYQLQVIGAYQGIFLSQLRRLCEDLRQGELARFRVGCHDAALYVSDLSEGYYLVLITDRTANEGVTWNRLMQTREVLMQEII